MNSKDPIENLFKENQHGLDEIPNSALWERIESKLEEREERARGIFLWWKYAAAAVVVFLMSWSMYFIANQTEKSTPESINVVLQPIEKTPQFNEINEDNKTEILDKIEQEQTAIAFENVTSSKNKIEEVKQLKSNSTSDDIYEVWPASTDEIYMKELEIATKAEAKMSSPMMKEKAETSKTFDAEMMDARRLGNSNFDSNQFSAIVSSTISVPVRSKNYLYQISSRENDSFTLKNEEVEFPQEVKFTQKENEIVLEFKGNQSKMNSRKSKLIQAYFEQKKSEIYAQISDSK